MLRLQNRFDCYKSDHQTSKRAQARNLVEDIQVNYLTKPRSHLATRQIAFGEGSTAIECSDESIRIETSAYCSLTYQCGDLGFRAAVSELSGGNPLASRQFETETAARNK